MNAEELAEKLGARRSGRQWKCKCVAHEDNSPSMIIFDGRSAVQVRCLAGCEPAEIIAALKAHGLWSGPDEQDCSTKLKTATLTRVSHETDRRTREMLRIRALAREIFDNAGPIDGTLAARYFERRDLLVDARMVADIRFTLRCPREGSRQPAVVVAMRQFETNAVMAIQRVFLTRDGKKDGAMMLGSASGSAMQLQRLQDGVLHICEGLETGLALIAQGRGPVWALGSASLIQSFPVIETVDELVIWADHDPIDRRTGRRPGLHAAAICEQRWRDAGKVADTYKAKTEKWDCADVWSSRCGRL